MRAFQMTAQKGDEFIMNEAINTEYKDKQKQKTINGLR